MKSRTILKYQYDEIGTFLCNTYIEKNHLMEKKAEAQKKIFDLMAENLPDIVKQAYKQYPDYFALKKRNIYNITKFVNANTSQYDPAQYGALDKIKNKKKNYSPESIEFANYIYDSLNKLDLVKYSGSSYFGYNSTSKYNIFSFDFIGLEISKSRDTGNSCYYNSQDDVDVIAKYALSHPEVKEIFLNYFIEAIKYLKFKKDISCAFSTITTTNMLKNEIPEAYDFFYKKWGKEYEKQDSYEKDRKKAEKKAQCDKIEGLRAAIS
jgi:hypothetical protein